MPNPLQDQLQVANGEAARNFDPARTRCMNLLVDALSVNNLSGRHVLFGHLNEIMRARGSRWRIGVLLNRDNAALRADAPPGVETHIAPTGSSWWQRAAWMRIHGNAWCASHGFDVAFSPSGMLSIGRIPQVVLAQNPWPMMSPTMLGKGRPRAWLQRRAYARAQRHAVCMVFNSKFMLDLYRRRFGVTHGLAVIAHQGISDDLLLPSERETEAPIAAPSPLVISLSAMARHKAVESLIDAFAKLRTELSTARLEIVGPWPDSGYRSEIQGQIERLHLSEHVRIRGFLPEAELKPLLRRARVFALLSRCESFGIPAVEAQAFGVPAVVADGTAAPEIIGDGGIVVPQGDATATAAAILLLLRDDGVWRETSIRASANAQRFHWHLCSVPLIEALDKIAAGVSPRGNL